MGKMSKFISDLREANEPLRDEFFAQFSDRAPIVVIDELSEEFNSIKGHMEEFLRGKGIYIEVYPFKEQISNKVKFTLTTFMFDTLFVVRHLESDYNEAFKQAFVAAFKYLKK